MHFMARWKEYVKAIQVIGTLAAVEFLSVSEKILEEIGHACIEGIIKMLRNKDESVLLSKAEPYRNKQQLLQEWLEPNIFTYAAEASYG